MNDPIKVIIIDDDENFSSALEILLKMQFHNITILGKAFSIMDGIHLINKCMPDLVFLDINFPEGNGFEIIESTKFTKYEVIFTTSFSEYAVRAFDVSALHYILKPIDLSKLKEAIERYNNKAEKIHLDEKLKILKESLLDKPKKILLPTSDGQNIYNISQIVWCEADGMYTWIRFNNGEKLYISRPLQHLHKTLAELDFVRIHVKYLVNLQYIKKYSSGKTSQVILEDGTILQISQHQKGDFLHKFKTFVKSL